MSLGPHVVKTLSSDSSLVLTLKTHFKQRGVCISTTAVAVVDRSETGLRWKSPSLMVGCATTLSLAVRHSRATLIDGFGRSTPLS